MGKKADGYVASRVNSVIGKGTEFEGTIRTKETVRVEGLVKGNVISEGTLIIGNGGVVDGRIETVKIFIGGEARGDIYATGCVEVNAGGRVFGNIHTKNLIVDETAIFEGTCEMLRENTEKKESKEEAPKEKTEEKTEE